MKNNYQPILLIGAARSGTKILRDTISTHPKVGKIGYDINFIWKRYNELIDHDELNPDHISPKVQKFIYRFFSSKNKGYPYLIEKTVSNTLRIPFLLKLFPHAKFIILYRDGRDAVESVYRQWNKAADNSYLFKKLMFVPFLQVVPYLFRYAVDTFKIKLKLKASESYVWGVRYKGYKQDLDKDDLITFCAKQWNHCANAIITHQSKIPAENILVIRYEELVTDPTIEFIRIATFLNLSHEQFDYSSIRSKNVGKSKNHLSQEDFQKVNNILSDTLEKLGYR